MNYLTSLLVGLTLCAPPPEEAFLSGVRPTEPLTPEQQQGTFHLPPGFHIQLFAAEPDIQKPMNMAFDARGRLWMTGSVEYPYAAKTERGADCVRVLEDTDGDGRADQITTFADGLNIPIGIYPYRDGAIVYSIPNIWFLRDTDGDGKADQRDVLYGPLGVPRDTHGMQNAFRRGFDGWLYVNHGFANETAIQARDGSRVLLQSGNTYRLRLDGSRVEQYTWGQVNPFGSTFLPTGDLVTADCHSKPLTLLLRGAYYSSFGKPHDGLGFAPDLVNHDHGSTAICGVAQLSGDHFPAEFQGRLLVGNVMTSRVNQDALQYTGATARGIEQPDFIRSDDPWFRPVDLQLGPDGAIYVADFYNRIIGHYEVPLEHPGRDKHRARIWRITYRDPGRPAEAGSRAPQLATASLEELIAALSHSNQTVRILATDQITDRIGETAVPELRVAARSAPSPAARWHSLWALHRLTANVDEELVVRATEDTDELVRVHAHRLLSETAHWTAGQRSAVVRGLTDPSPLVRRAAADAAGRCPDNLVSELLRSLPADETTDPALRHTFRMAVREQLRSSANWSTVQFEQLPPSLRPLVAEIAVGVPTAEGAEFLLAMLGSAEVDPAKLEPQLLHATTHLPVARLPELIATARRTLRDNIPLQSRIALAAHQRLVQRGLRSGPLLGEWAGGLVSQLLSKTADQQAMWLNVQGDGPWGLEERQCADEQTVKFLSSLPGGEQKTGTLRSRTFVIPPRLSFYLCGHLGFPSQPAVEKNYVQLRLTENGEVVAKALPPRHDRAQRVEWELGAHAGKTGYLEVVDQLTDSGYAWLAVARFEPPVVEVPTSAPGSLVDLQVAAAQLIDALSLTGFQPAMAAVVSDPSMDWRARKAAAMALVTPANRPTLAAAVAILSEPNVEPDLREQIARRVVEPLPAVPVAGDESADFSTLARVMKTVPSREQRLVADSLAGTPAGGEVLLRLLGKGVAAGSLLRDPTLVQKLTALQIPKVAEQVQQLVAALPPANLELQRLIDERRRAIRTAAPNLARGEELFRKHCAVCHQVRNQGALIGPQLDGIGNRGLDRVLEDVLDPNRNVDASFHVSLLELASGRVVTGLVRREEGTQLILADQQGKEFSVSRDEIEQRSQTRTSLMPANVHELLKPDEFLDLVGFLLSLRAPIE